ncbi:hypothetical protein BwDG23_65240 [Bradyrhizobium ottawaense]|nr:hypothetical protein BwSG20_68760 [Bradyrhizobium ottawaense]GMO85739.1 hypothetical protein BwSG10_65240 [Bradyrhizobium ottawaense]GMP10629.1 hypothetical protein BwDG23_65240 [Bradyrhizobium ottawaense]GMP20748.1 hypothetical protein BwSH12_67540 [Bradyrhizobium ottawaense]
MIGDTCMLLCGLLCALFAQQTAGARWHPAFPAPSWLYEGGATKQSSGGLSREIGKACLCFELRATHSIS